MMIPSDVQAALGGIGLALFMPTLWGGDGPGLYVAAETPQGPGGLTFAPDGSMVLSLHQSFESRERVIRIDRNGDSSPFPNAQIATGDGDGVVLDAVMGLHAGENGIIWMLDNGRRSETLPKVVGWDSQSDQVHKVVYLPAPATRENSFLADMAVDPSNDFLYIADPASGEDAALVVVNIKTGLTRRLLQGHISVVPEDIPLLIRGKRIGVKRADGSMAEPLAGINPIALDRKGKWLYFGPLKGRRLYRVEARLLKDFSLSEHAVAAAVEPYSLKPICDSIVIDQKNHIYAADLTRHAIVVIPPQGKSARERKPQVFVQDSLLSWPDGLAFGPDQRLYFYCSQIDQSSWFNHGQDRTQGPFRVYRVKALHQPLLGKPFAGRNPLTELKGQISDRFGANP